MTTYAEYESMLAEITDIWKSRRAANPDKLFGWIYEDFERGEDPESVRYRFLNAKCREIENRAIRSNPNFN